MIVDVPDLTHPTKCWAQAPQSMVRCDFPKGHTGPHAWERSTRALLPAVIWQGINTILMIPQPTQIER